MSADAPPTSHAATGRDHTMQAIVQREYGSPNELTLEEIERPVPGDDEVLVRVRAASVHPDVWHVVLGVPYVLRLMGAGLRRPKNPVPGTDLAGRVESIGENVAQFEPGDEVFGESLGGFAWVNGGTYAEYATVPEEILVTKPDDVTFEEAAAVPNSGIIALHGLRHQGQLQAGQTVLINGAGGGVGTMAVQLAAAFGAEVTGVDHGDKLETVRSLGADHVVDYTRTDFTRGSERYDLVLDVPGNHPFAACRRVLTPGGTYVLIGHDQFGESGRRVLGSLPRFAKLVAMSRLVSQLPNANFSMPPKGEAMRVLRDFLEAEALTPFVDETFPLREVPEAIRYLESGRVRGRVVVTV